MTFSPIVTAQARRDLNEQVRWFRQQADRDIARKFALNANQTFQNLAVQPALGPEIDSENPNLVAVRKWRVDGFPKLLIFYTVKGRRVAIIRVLHTAQDWWSLLDFG
jgi:toxin ParE1/3/4